MKVLDNNNIISNDGKILFYSIEDFINNICLSDSCFICGTKKADVEFNNEHVLPKWLLKRYNLFNEGIGLSNRKTVKYSQYKIKCCKKCNTLLGNKIETPISNGLKGEYEQVKKFIEENHNLVCIWLTLIAFKTFLNDRRFKFDYENDTKISDFYDYKGFHHLHCVIRSIYTGCQIDKFVLGSLFILPTTNKDNYFDYIDSYEFHSSYINLGGISLIYIYNDAEYIKFRQTKYMEYVGTKKFNIIQCRELYCKMSYLNTIIKNRPKFSTGLNKDKNTLTIFPTIDRDMTLNTFNKKSYGELLYFYIMNIQPDLIPTFIHQQKSNILTGFWSYLFEPEGMMVMSGKQ